MKGKRFILLAALVASVLVPATSHAAVKWVWEPVSWHTQSTSFTSLNVDSSIACGAAAARLDTTSSIFIGNWAPGEKASVVSAVDSVLFALFTVTGGGAGSGLTDNFDSLYVSIQVSQDGVNWALATPYSGGAIGFNTTTNRGGYMIDDAATNTFTFWLRTHWISTTNSVALVVAGATAPDWRQLAGWQYIRFITRAGTNTGCYQAKIGHWAWY